MRNILLLTAAAMVLFMSSCTTYHRTMADSNSRVNFTAKDFTITAPYGGEAVVTKIIGIDWQRLFTKRVGNFGENANSLSIPVVGSLLSPTTADNYAMFDLLKRHPKYDAVFYPHFKRKHFNLLGIYSRTLSTVTARLGRLNVGGGEGDEEEEKKD